MNEADTAGQQVTIGNLPADTDEEGNPGLNLMPIRTLCYPETTSASSFPSRTRKRTPSLMSEQ
jgi:hypothetical protein